VIVRRQVLIYDFHPGWTTALDISLFFALIANAPLSILPAWEAFALGRALGTFSVLSGHVFTSQLFEILLMKPIESATFFSRSTIALYTNVAELSVMLGSTLDMMRQLSYHLKPHPNSDFVLI